MLETLFLMEKHAQYSDNKYDDFCGKWASPAVGRQGIYTLEGVKVEKTQPGHIYIIDGKKVFVK